MPPPPSLHCVRHHTHNLHNSIHNKDCFLIGWNSENIVLCVHCVYGLKCFLACHWTFVGVADVAVVGALYLSCDLILFNRNEWFNCVRRTPLLRMCVRQHGFCVVSGSIWWKCSAIHLIYKRFHIYLTRRAIKKRPAIQLMKVLNVALNAVQNRRITIIYHTHSHFGGWKEQIYYTQEAVDERTTHVSNKNEFRNRVKCHRCMPITFTSSQAPLYEKIIIGVVVLHSHSHPQFSFDIFIKSFPE